MRCKSEHLLASVARKKEVGPCAKVPRVTTESELCLTYLQTSKRHLLICNLVSGSTLMLLTKAPVSLIISWDTVTGKVKIKWRAHGAGYGRV